MSKYENICWTGVFVGLMVMLVGAALLVTTRSEIVLGVGLGMFTISMLAGIPGIIYAIWKQ